MLQTVENIKSAYHLGVIPFQVQIPMLGSEWADTYFYLSPESSGTEGKWKCYPYQIGPLNWMTSDDIEEFNWMKSRRVGYTKCLLAAVGCQIEQKNRNVAIWQPMDGDAKDFVTDEVETMLRDVSVLGDKLKCAVGMKSKWNTVEKKVFHGATLDIKGGKSARNYRRMTKDVAIYDETDGFDRDIDGEGSCFELGDGRLDQAPFPKSIRGSTPKTKGASLIESAVENSDMVFYRFVPCPHCGELQRLEFSGLKWDDKNPDTARYICKKGCEIYYRDYSAMDAAGRWQTVDGYYYSDHDDRFYDPEDNQINKPRRIGARIWAVYSYLRPWSYIVDRWIMASKEAKTGNIITLKSVINTLLGETFEQTGQSVDPEPLANRGEDYLSTGAIPNGVLLIVAGVDVQGGINSRLELEIVGYGLESESWSLDYVVIRGEPERQEVWQALNEQLLRTFKRVDGAELRISCVFIDSGYLPSMVYRFTARKRKRKIFAIKGMDSGDLIHRATWQGDKKRARAMLYGLNVSDAKYIFYTQLEFDKPGPGYCHFPDHYTPKHFRQLTNEESRDKLQKGKIVGQEWHKKGANEQLDCRVYAYCAFRHLIDNFSYNLAKIKLRLERQAAASSGEQVETQNPQPTVIEQMTKKRKKNIRGKTKRGGFVNRWKK